MANNIGRIHQPNELTSKIENTKDVAHNGKHVDVQCFPLASYIMALNITSVDYFSLDVEGSEMEVLQTIPFNLVDIKVTRLSIHIPSRYKTKFLSFPRVRQFV